MRRVAGQLLRRVLRGLLETYHMSSKVDIDPAAESVSWGHATNLQLGTREVARPQRCRDRDGIRVGLKFLKSSLAAISKLRGDDEAHQYAKGAVFCLRRHSLDAGERPVEVPSSHHSTVRQRPHHSSSLLHWECRGTCMLRGSSL